jgi:hypothetical protein
MLKASLNNLQEKLKDMEDSTEHKIPLTESQQLNTEQDVSCITYHKESKAKTHISTYTPL